MKVNVIARLEFELAYFEVVVQVFNHYAAETPVKEQLCRFCPEAEEVGIVAL